jgi:aspartate aminotransferase
MKISEKMGRIKMSGIRKMFDMAKEDSVHLGLGEPDFQPPEHVIQAMKDALDEGHNKYGPTNGIPALRQAIADDLNKTFGSQGKRVGFDGQDQVMDENIIVTSSGTEALGTITRVMFEDGDEVLYPNPGFVLYAPQITLTEATPVDYPLTHDNEFVPRVDDLQERVTPKTRAVILNSPNNPTGGVHTALDVDELIKFARDNEITIISDDVYEKVVYEGVHESMIGKYDDLIMVNSFSKTYCMTGWRIGYLAAPQEMAAKLSIGHYYSVACSPSPIQHAVLAALTGPQDFVDDMVNEYRERRDLIVDLCNDIPGIECLKPRGAFYVFPKFEHDIKSEDLAMECVKNGLICSPGTAFGSYGEGHIRFSYANNKENIQKGLDIFKKTYTSL